MSTQEQNTPTLDELATQYVNIAYIDYGDLDEQAERDIKNAYKTGYRRALTGVMLILEEPTLGHGCMQFHVGDDGKPNHAWHITGIKEIIEKLLESKHP